MTPPAPTSPRSTVLDALSRYWSAGPTPVAELPIPEAGPPKAEALPPTLRSVDLPPWAEDVGVDGALLLPPHCVAPGEGPPWTRTDWLAAALWYLNGSAERAVEARRGPIHSYASRLRPWPSALWDRAWVNRVALFLRRWATREQEADEAALLGPLPAPEIVITHDVDAVAKTLAIRLKQSAFGLYGAARALLHGRPVRSLAAVGGAGRFLLSPADYWCLEEVAEREREAGLRSRVYVYGGPHGWRRGPREMLLDPGYDVCDERIGRSLRALHGAGWTIGVHLSYNSWQDAARMRRERERVEQAVGAEVTCGRQHWLRFGWQSTWPAQVEAGLTEDATLGFNDRPGFRTGAALAYRPWAADGAQLPITILPTVLMDSHLYDYADLTEGERRAAMDRWLGEVIAVRGTAAVIWHQRTLSPDYGWAAGFEHLVSRAAEGAV